MIYTTNLIESMNARLRKVTRNRGQFPSEQAVLKVLYLTDGPGPRQRRGLQRSSHHAGRFQDELIRALRAS